MLLALTPVFIFTACSNPFPQRMVETESTTQTRWAELALHPEPTIAYLDWPRAVALLESSNFKLIESREALRVARNNWQRLPRRFIPELNFNLFTSPTFSEVSQGDLTNTYFQIGGLLDLPTPWRYRAQALETNLHYALAQTKLELLRREQYVGLYRLFRDAEAVAKRQKQQQALTALGKIDNTDAYAHQAAKLQMDIQSEWRKIEGTLGELLGDQNHRWRPDINSQLPVFDYTTKPPALNGQDGFAALQLTHTALQILGLEAARQGLLLSSWPRFSVLISAPPIYQSSTGNSSFLSIDDLRITPFISYSTDFRGHRKAAREQNSHRSDIARRQIDQAMQTTLLRLRDGAALLTKLAQQHKRLHEVIQALPAGIPSTELREKQAELDSQIDELNLTFWVFDTQRW